MRKINQYKTTYNKEIGAFIGLIICFVVFVMPGMREKGVEYYISEPKVFMEPVVVEPEPSLEEKIKEYFPRSHKTMIAIAHAESRMRMDAIGYNCYYNADETIVYKTRVAKSHSAACKKEHREYAWSVDCFALQKNYVGRKTCPEGVTVDMHLREVAELSKVQHFNAWVAYKNGSYKKFLASN